MVAGHLREKRGYFHIVLSYVDENGKRQTPSKSTGLPIKGNKKRAEAMLMEARKEMEDELKQAGGYSDRRGRSKSAKGIGGKEPGTGANRAAYAPGEGGTAGRKGGGESFFSGWLILSLYRAILVLAQSDKSIFSEVNG